VYVYRVLVADTKSLIGKDLSNRDLRRTDLTGKVLFGTDLRGSNLRGSKISIDCATFDGLKLDDNQVGMLLKMIAKADIALEWRAGLDDLIERVAGTDRFRAISRVIRQA
jgi:uncharacterized protein YjbI with pentapeptide repeats